MDREMCSVYLSSLCSADIQDWGQLRRSGPCGASQTVQPQILAYSYVQVVVDVKLHLLELLSINT